MDPSEETSNFITKINLTRNVSFKDRNSNIYENEDIEASKIQNYIALYDREPVDKNEVGIKKNDRLILIRKMSDNTLLVKNIRSKNEGTINVNLVKVLANDYESKDWYFSNISRSEAEHLLDYETECGAFLIRKNDECFVLSILDASENKLKYVKHYKILHSTDLFYISDKATFKTLDDLIAYYTADSHGLCSPLRKPCTKNRAETNDKNDKWEEDNLDNIELIFPILDFEYGEIYKGKLNKKFNVAVKIFNAKADHDDEFKEAKETFFYNEVEILKKLRHENLVKLWCVSTVIEPKMIVTEYIPNGTLLNYMKMGIGADFNFNDIIYVAAQVTAGMRYMEESRCVHRDLGARNIFVGENNLVKIGNFSFAKFLNKNKELVMTKSEIKQLKLKWTAPEIIFYDKSTETAIYTSKSDVWSFGVLLYELITLGSEPFSNINNRDFKSKLAENIYFLPKPDKLCNEDYYSTMSLCCERNPNDRPSFQSLSVYFRKYFSATREVFNYATQTTYL